MTLQLARRDTHGLGSHHSLLATSGALTLQLQRGPVIEVFPTHVIEPIRHMVTQGMYKGDFARRISIVSSLQEEGVTYTSRALATALAHDTGRTVCLVDLNWWSPDEMSVRLSKYYDGITDILYNGALVDDALIATTNPFLTMVLAGGVDPRQRPILSRDTDLGKLMNALSERFDHLLFDIPAIKSSSDSIALASLGESCCVVVRQGVTSTRVVGQVLSELDHMPIMGVLMNRVQTKTPKWFQKLIPPN